MSGLRIIRGATQSDFILKAVLEKLQNEGIEIDEEALRDKRARNPVEEN
jgi:hypothetical protein